MNNAKPTQVLQIDARGSLRKRYDRLWSATIGQIRAGKTESDPVLAARLPDRRRGLTVVARPSLNVRQRVAAWVDQLRELEPDQHYYAPTELHLTVLSLFTATIHPEPFLAQTGHYVAAVEAALRSVAPIRVEFVGVTASPNAIMIQGFLETESLNDVRDTLRRQLRARGLAKGLDGRYRLETAHMTVIRFRAPLRDGERFAAALESARDQPFGVTCIQSASLVENDWYMSQSVTKTVKRYRLIHAV